MSKSTSDIYFGCGDVCYHPDIKGAAVYICKDPRFDTGSYILPDELSFPLAVSTDMLTKEPQSTESK